MSKVIEKFPIASKKNEFIIEVGPLITTLFFFFLIKLITTFFQSQVFIKLVCAIKSKEEIDNHRMVDGDF